MLGVVENMSGLSQQLHKFRFFSSGPDGTQQDVTEQLLQHLPPELQVTACSSVCGKLVRVMPLQELSNVCNPAVNPKAFALPVTLLCMCRHLCIRGRRAVVIIVVFKSLS